MEKTLHYDIGLGLPKVRNIVCSFIDYRDLDRIHVGMYIYISVLWRQLTLNNGSSRNDSFALLLIVSSIYYRQAGIRTFTTIRTTSTLTNTTYCYYYQSKSSRLSSCVTLSPMMVVHMHPLVRKVFKVMAKTLQ